MDATKMDAPVTLWQAVIAAIFEISTPLHISRYATQIKTNIVFVYCNFPATTMSLEFGNMHLVQICRFV